MRYASDLEAGQLRKLAATIGFAHDPQAFAASALRRLAVEPAQYPQWELLWGTLSAWSGAGYRDFWDVWQNAPDLQFRLSYKREEDAVLSTEGQRTALDWLEAGSRPQNDQVYDWLLATISSAARGGARPSACCASCNGCRPPIGPSATGCSTRSASRRRCRCSATGPPSTVRRRRWSD